MALISLRRRRRAGAPIHVACGTDRGWLRHSATMLRSAMIAQSRRVHAHVVVAEGVSEREQGMLRQMVDELGGTLSIYRVPRSELGELLEIGAAGMWYRTYLPELIQDLDRVLYLDSDTIVVDSIEPLWQTDLGPHLLGAVTTVFPSPEWGSAHCAAFGVPAPELYFNSGVMLLDLAALRAGSWMERVREFALARGDRERLWESSGHEDSDQFRAYVREHPERMVFVDQDAFNGVLAERRLPLAPRWNCMQQVHVRALSEPIFGTEAVDEAIRSPAILHLAGPADTKPWSPHADPAMRELYWGHRNRTPWPAEPPGELVGEIHADPGHPREEFFEPWREHRRRRYASVGAPARKRRAVVTMVHDESVFLPIWLRYYSRFFEPDDIYVLDNDTTDGSTDGPGFVRVPAPSDRVDHTWMVETLAAFQHELIDRYDAVMVTDVDEIIAPDPSWGDLGQYIDRLDEDFVNALGYEVIHLPDREPPLDLDQPILGQRAYWFANDAYDKPLLATVPMEWVPGFHSTLDGSHNEDPDLRLIHLHRMDYEMCRSRHATRATRAWNRRDVEKRWAAYNRISESEEFRTWFHTDSGFEDQGIHILLERIPQRWRGVV